MRGGSSSSSSSTDKNVAAHTLLNLDSQNKEESQIRKE